MRDFDPNHDRVQLFGESDRYSTQLVGDKTQVFYKNGNGTSDLIAIFVKTSTLELTSTAFDYIA